MATRETSVAQPAPARPSAGNPQLPYIHTQLSRTLRARPKVSQASEIQG